jgi:hypothetical protein
MLMCVKCKNYRQQLASPVDLRGLNASEKMQILQLEHHNTFDSGQLPESCPNNGQRDLAIRRQRETTKV